MDANDRNDNGKDGDTRIDPTAEGGPTTPVIPGTGGAQAGGGPHVGATEGGTRGVLGIGGNPAGTPTSGLGSGAPQSDDGDSGDGDPGEEPERPAD